MPSINIYQALRNIPFLVGGMLAGFILAYSLHTHGILVPVVAIALTLFPFIIAVLTGMAKTTTV